MKRLRDATKSGGMTSIGVPMLIELSLGIGVGLVGTMMAAQLSDASGGAFALANHVASMLFIFFRVVGAGVGVVVTQAIGSGNCRRADRLACGAIGASSWAGLLTAAAALITAVPLMRLMNAPDGVAQIAVPFLQLLAPAMLLDAWLATLSSVLRAHLFNRDTLAVVFVVNISQLLIAWPLMVGIGPIPAIGLAGFAAGLVASKLIGIALFLLLWKIRLGMLPTAADWWRLPRDELRALLHIGLPGAAENIVYRLAFMASVSVAGLLGTGALATQAYVLQISYLTLMFGLATGLSAEIAVGHLVGAGRLHDAHRLVRRALLAGIAFSIAATGASALLAPWTLQLFTADAAIIGEGVLLLWCTVLLEPGRTFNLVVINALRAAGDARFPFFAGAISMLVVLAGGSWLLGIHFGLGLKGVWLAYALDEWIRGLIMWRRWVSLGWTAHARRARRRNRHANMATAPG